MGNDYAVGGLLKGLGQGGMKIAEMRYQRERDTAEHERKKSILSFGQELSDESLSARTESERGHQAGLLTESQGREDTAKKTEVTGYRSMPDGMEQAVNVYGEDVGAPRERSATPAEASMTNALAKALTDANTKDEIKAAVWDNTQDELFAQTFANYGEFVIGKDPETTTFSDFSIQFMDAETGKLNKTAALTRMKTDNPEMYNAYLQKQTIVENYLQQKVPPAQAVAMANREYEALKQKKVEQAQKATDDETAASKKRVRAGLEKDEQIKWNDTPVTQKNVEAVAARVNELIAEKGNSSEVFDMLDDLKIGNFAFYTAVMPLVNQSGNAVESKQGLLSK